MKILFSGDSFTYGDELSNREKDRFSRLVSDHFHAEEINLGTNGSSNDKIVRNVFEHLSLWDVDAVVIQFSEIKRFDVYQHNDPAILIKNAVDPLYNEGWVSIAPANIGGEFGEVDHFRKSRLQNGRFPGSPVVFFRKINPPVRMEMSTCGVEMSTCSCQGARRNARSD